MTLHKEIHFESEICEHLAAHGWLYSEGDAQGYDRVRALFPADVVAWVAGHSAQSMGRLGQESRRTGGRCIGGTAAGFHQSTRHAGRVAPRR